MTDYTKTTNFAAKDALVSGNPAKVVKGTEVNTEFDNIATAVATKANLAGPTFTGASCHYRIDGCHFEGKNRASFRNRTDDGLRIHRHRLKHAFDFIFCRGNNREPIGPFVLKKQFLNRQGIFDLDALLLKGSFHP